MMRLRGGMNVALTVLFVGLSTNILNSNIHLNIQKKKGDSTVENHTSVTALRVGALHDRSGTGHRSRICKCHSLLKVRCDKNRGRWQRKR